MKRLLFIALVLFCASAVATAQTRDDRAGTAPAPFVLQANWFQYPGYAEVAYIQVSFTGGVAPYFGSIITPSGTLFVLPTTASPSIYEVPVSGPTTVIVNLTDSAGVTRTQALYVGAVDGRAGR